MNDNSSFLLMNCNVIICIHVHICNQNDKLYVIMTIPFLQCSTVYTGIAMKVDLANLNHNSILVHR